MYFCVLLSLTTPIGIGDITCPDVIGRCCCGPTVCQLRPFTSTLPAEWLKAVTGLTTCSLLPVKTRRPRYTASSFIPTRAGSLLHHKRVALRGESQCHSKQLIVPVSLSCLVCSEMLVSLMCLCFVTVGVFSDLTLSWT